MKVKKLVIAMLSLSVTPVFSATNLGDIQVTATRENTGIQNLASNATVITADNIAERGSTTLDEALALQPGVSMYGQGRFGIEDIAIRGISGNRVKILYDGMPVADRFWFGPYQNSGRVYFDLNEVDRVEIIRGPVSSLHGASALGGVVSVEPTRPNTYLKDDKRIGGKVEANYNSSNRAETVGGSLAFKPFDSLSGLISYRYTGAHERSGADVDNQPESQEITRHNVTGSLVWQINPSHRLSLNGGYHGNYIDSHFINRRSGKPTLAKDTQEHYHASLKYDFVLSSLLADSGYLKGYIQKQKSAQVTGIFYDNLYQTRTLGLDLQLDKSVEGLVKQDWIYGASWVHRHVNMLQANPIGHGQAKNAPDTTVDEVGIFAQGRLALGLSGIALIPGLRFDYYHLQPNVDEAFTKTVDELYASGKAPKPSVRQYQSYRFSPRLGLLYKLNDSHSIYANYSEGFRSPSFAETNLAFVNLTGKPPYALVENPNLKPEVSRGAELGWRMDAEVWSHSITGHYTRYWNFIESLAPQGFNRQGFLEFKTVNRDQVEIYGVEWQSHLNFGEIVSGLKGFSLDTALAYARGKDLGTQSPVNTIDPLNGTVKLSYDQTQKKWGVSATVNASAGKKQKDIAVSKDPRNPGALPLAGYMVVDLAAYVQPVQDLTIRGGVYNLLDKQYNRWANARSQTEAQRIRYSEPGRYFNVSMQYRF